MEIELPSLDWMTAEFNKKSGRGNAYSGSFGTDPKKGCLTQTLFEYTAVIVRTEVEDADGNKKKIKTLTAAWRIRPPYPAKATEDTVRDFPGDEEGRRAAEAWLSEALAASGVKASSHNEKLAP